MVNTRTRRTKRQPPPTLLDHWTMDLVRASREMGERVERQRVLDWLRGYGGATAVEAVAYNIEMGRHDAGRVLRRVDLDTDENLPPKEAP